MSLTINLDFNKLLHVVLISNLHMYIAYRIVELIMVFIFIFKRENEDTLNDSSRGMSHMYQYFLINIRWISFSRQISIMSSSCLVPIPLLHRGPYRYRSHSNIKIQVQRPRYEDALRCAPYRIRVIINT